MKTTLSEMDLLLYVQLNESCQLGNIVDTPFPGVLPVVECALGVILKDYVEIS